MDVARIAAALPSPAGVHARFWDGWRIAAAITIMVLGGSSLVTLRERGARLDSLTVASGDSMRGGARTGAVELMLGGPFGDLTDAQLRTLLREIKKLDALPSAEPDVVVPISPLPRSGGT